MPRIIHHDRMVKLVQRALASNGVRVSTGTIEWPLHGDCHDPWRTSVYGRPRTEGEKYVVIKSDGKIPMEVIISTRCRRCPPCKKARQSMWRYRVREETRNSARTWFGTLTMAPDAQYQAVMAARRYARERCVPWDELTNEEQFRRIADASLKEVTRYIKRVRKNSGVPLRYIAVTEKHKSGNPHFHMLVHETALRPVTHRILSDAWVVGFEKWRLVPFDQPGKATYLCKYLSKDMVMRVRASQQYGQLQSEVDTSLIVAKTMNVLRRSEQSQ